MIDIQQLYKKFGRLSVLHGINLSCKKGECVALIGPNGCGKTTLIKSILGMVIPDKGRILFNGEEIAGTVDYRRQLGYMPQIGRYPDNMRIGQVIDMIRSLRSDVKITDDDLFKAYKMDALLDKPMRTLSGGTRQKVSAVIAFMFSPAVYILDEPTAGLDPVAAEILKEKMVTEQAMGKLLIITSHLMNELEDVVTEVVYMQDGEVRFHKSKAQLMAEAGGMRLSKSITQLLQYQLS